MELELIGKGEKNVSFVNPLPDWHHENPDHTPYEDEDEDGDDFIEIEEEEE
jgi:hypothetical protein